MLKYLFLSLLSLCWVSAPTAAQEKLSSIIRFDTDTHDFGKIKQGTPVHYRFNFTNLTDAPLVIAQVQTSCGCTTPEYPKKPVMSGAGGSINIGYDAKHTGNFRKTIHVQIAGVKELKELIIKGEVLKK